MNVGKLLKKILHANKNCQSVYGSLAGCSAYRGIGIASDKGAMTDGASELARLDIDENCKPFELFKQWMNEYTTCTHSAMVTFSLATASKDGDVSNRTLVLRRVLEDSFVFVTRDTSKKICQIKENPKVAACFLFSYENKDSKKVSRQVLVEGVAEELPRSECETHFEEEPLYCKIRAHICDQGKKVNWDELKTTHDALLKEVKSNKKKLEMPEAQVAYKIIPHHLDFYHAFAGQIADRILFKKDGCEWNYCRICT